MAELPKGFGFVGLSITSDSKASPDSRVRAGDVHRANVRGCVSSLRAHVCAHGARLDATTCPTPSMHRP